MTQEVRLASVADTEEHEFLTMAEAYFRELNPQFAPLDDWRKNYFPRLQSARDLHLRWICGGVERMGFVVYGVETHRFLTRTIGYIQEFYVLPQFRRSGVGRQVAVEVIRTLRQFSPSKIQLEIASGNAPASLFWQTLGFRKVSERFVLNEGQK